MWRMTIHAGRDDMGLFAPQLTAHNFLVHFFDLSMTLHTGCGYLSPADGRCRIRMRQNMMRGVTVCTHCGDNETPFEQALSVY